MDKPTYRPTECPRCGKPLPRDAAEGLCPSCLVAAGAQTMTGDLSEAPTMMTLLPNASAEDRQRLEPGRQWGPYRIGQLLGKGGMGEVYEAEHLETGRRLALKVLRSRLHRADDRARFLREGQLAASISHPHTVYIFGSEEISGSPVISMELLPGGTLKDRVAAEGPLPTTEAVSAILDIIGGLDAAQAAGILHRDIKPSNCFLDNHGTVKVGDFGLSISTLARDVHQDLDTSTFQGTPQFAPPEQLRGEPLDVRADIYAVGGTLYYLLTGRPVFDAKDLRELFQRVTNDSPESPRRIRREIPAGLADVVLQCLAKDPSQRPASYAALATALRPFATGLAPAGLGIRLIAGLIDAMVVSFPVSAGVAVTGAALTEASTTSILGMSVSLLTLAYYVVLEGIWKASLGKRLFHLRVASITGAPAPGSRVVIRTLIYFLPGLLLGLSATAGLFTAEAKSSLLRSSIGGVLAAAMFMTARSRNGWAGIHEVLSGTRVVSRSDGRDRRVGTVLQSAAAAGASVRLGEERRLGPFLVKSEITLRDGQLLVALDPILRRHVWIRSVPAGMPPISAARRDVSRSGRLHWLAGRRSSDENWDAFEAPSGEPMLTHPQKSEWSSTKLQLLDLADELSAARKDGTVPSLGLDRMWTRADGRMLLLDFQAPGLEATPEPGKDGLTPEQLLSAAASHLVPNTMAAAGSISLSARNLLNRLAQSSPPQLEETRTSLTEVARIPDRVARWRRAIPIGLAAAPIVLLTVFALLMLPSLFGFMTRYSEMFTLLEALHRPTPPPGSRLVNPEIRAAYEKYLVGRYGETLRDDRFWSSPIMKNLADRRRTAQEILVRYPSISGEELASATAIVEAERARAGRRRNQGEDPRSIAEPIVGALGLLALAFVMSLSMLSSLIVPGGLLGRFLGLAVVTGDGTEISRARSFIRTVVAWSPAIGWLAYLVTAPKIQGWVPSGPLQLPLAIAAFGAIAAGAVWSIANPGRGPHDRLVGTFVVPR